MLFETLEDYDKAIAESDARIKDLDERHKKSQKRSEKAEQNRVTAITNRLKDDGYVVTVDISVYGYAYTLLELDDKTYQIASYIPSKSEDENYRRLKTFVQILTVCHQFIAEAKHGITWRVGDTFNLDRNPGSIYISEDTGDEKCNAQGLDRAISLNYNLETETYALTLQTETETRSRRYFKNHYPITKDISLAVSSFDNNDTLILRHETTQPTSLETLSTDFYRLFERPNPLNWKEV